MGIALVVSFLTKQETYNPQYAEFSFPEKIMLMAFESIVEAAFVLLFGWIVHLFM